MEERAKLEEARLMKSIQNKRKGTNVVPWSQRSKEQEVPKTQKSPVQSRNRSQTTQITPTKKEEPEYETKVETVTVIENGKKITKRITKKIIKKKISDTPVVEMDWQEGDPCFALYTKSQKWLSAVISKPTPYGSYWVIFKHNEEKQECIKSALRPVSSHDYTRNRATDKDKQESAAIKSESKSTVLSEPSAGFTFLHEQQEEIAKKEEERLFGKVGIAFGNEEDSSSKTETKEDSKEDSNKSLFNNSVMSSFPVESSHQPRNDPNNIIKSEVVEEHLYDAMSSQEMEEERKTKVKKETRRLSRRIYNFDPEEEERKIKKEEEDRILKEKQEKQRKKVEERLRLLEEKQKLQNNDN